MRRLWCLALVLMLASACGGTDSQATATFIPSPAVGTATLASPIVSSATGTPGVTPTGPVATGSAATSSVATSSAATAVRPTAGAPGALTIAASDGVKLAAV
ncbi:MAG TPA: hypothetical protein VM536_19675, partial [Chloroflexia bacterium]|nr:hypothetical protein [Chloroflexia bacterium]